MKDYKFKMASLSDDCTHIIDVYGNKINLDDSRVVHFWPFHGNATPLIRRIFENRGWRTGMREPVVSNDVLTYCKKLCSGKECTSFYYLTGIFYEYILKNYCEDEIFIYWGVKEDCCPCQVSAWSDVYNIFSERLGIRNAVYAVSTINNNFFGQGFKYSKDMLTALILGDIFDEAENVLKSLALNKEEALAVMKRENIKVVPYIQKGTSALSRSLKMWAENISKIPLKATLNATPKIYMLGGGSTALAKDILEEYCYKSEVIPKISEFNELFVLFSSNYARYYGFIKGCDNLKQQLDYRAVIRTIFMCRYDMREIKYIILSLITVYYSNYLNNRFRTILQKSGAVFDKHVSFIRYLEEGHKYTNENIINEASYVVGKYINIVKNGIVDGVVHISFFTCHQSKTAQAILKNICHQYDMPFAALEMEGPWFATNHIRLLENVIRQAKKVREYKISG